VAPEHLAVVRNAMVGVNKEGTSAAAFRGAGYVAGGKTGTAQVVAIKQNEKYNAAKVSEHLRDHALYIAYGPAEVPRIAVALVVENAGFGAQSAAPIARRVLDYWLQATYPSEQDIAAVQRGEAPAPIGAPRVAADVPLSGSFPGRSPLVMPVSATVPGAMPAATAAAANAGAASAPGASKPGKPAATPASAAPAKPGAAPRPPAPAKPATEPAQPAAPARTVQAPPPSSPPPAQDGARQAVTADRPQPITQVDSPSPGR
jgi:penicillin-binding protein 2